MKPKHTVFSTALLAVSALGLQYSTAADLYWDANGGTTGVGGNGNWTAGNTWRTGSDLGALGAWSNNNVAVHTTTAGTLTANSNVAVNGLLLGNADTFIVASSGANVLTFNNVANNLGVANAGIISATLAGTLNIYTNGTPGTLGARLSGTNTNVTATNIGLTAGGYGVRITNASALGSASATVKVTSGFLVLDHVTASTGITYNAWATELAGGGIRVRNAQGGTAATSTYAGDLTLTGNSALSVRGAALVGLNATGTVNLNANTLTLTAGDNSAGIDMQNAISGSGNITLNTNVLDTVMSSGNGVARLSVANTFSGTATVTKGTLGLNHVNALQNATLDTGTSGTINTVSFTVAGTNTYNIGGLTGSDNLAIGANTLSVGAKAGSFSYGAEISGTGGLTKVGSSSTQILSGTNTYEGATLVSAGTLLVTGALSNSAVTVSDTATLGGGGTVNGISFGGDSFFDIALALAGNPLDSTADISFAATGFGIDNLVFNGATVDWGTVSNGTYTLITGTLNSTNLGNFGSANAFDIDGISGSRTAYFQNGSLQLVVIPEPSTAALLGGLGLLALLRRRRG